MMCLLLLQQKHLAKDNSFIALMLESMALDSIQYSYDQLSQITIGCFISSAIKRHVRRFSQLATGNGINRKRSSSNSSRCHGIPSIE